MWSPGDPPHIVQGVGYSIVTLEKDRWTLSFPTFLYNGFPLTSVPVLMFCFANERKKGNIWLYLIPDSKKWRISIEKTWCRICFIKDHLFATSCHTGIIFNLQRNINGRTLFHHLPSLWTCIVFFLTIFHFPNICVKFWNLWHIFQHNLVNREEKWEAYSCRSPDGPKQLLVSPWEPTFEVLPPSACISVQNYIRFGKTSI